MMILDDLVDGLADHDDYSPLLGACESPRFRV